MFDITGPKVLIPSILFAIMTPRFLFAFPPGASLTQQAAIHAIISVILYYLICKFIAKVTLTKADLIVPVVLSIMLTPGLLVTIPHVDGPTAIGVSTAAFAITFAALRGIFPEYY